MKEAVARPAYIPGRVDRGSLVLAATVAVVAAAIFAPGHLGDQWVERGFALTAAAIGVIIAAVYGIPTRVGRVRSMTLLLVLLATTVLYAVSIFRADLSPEVTLGMRDYFELGRYPIQAGVLLVLAAGFYAHPQGFRAAVDRLAVALPSAALVSYLVVMTDLPGAGMVVNFYAEAKTTFGPPGDARLSIPFANPNYLGIACVWVLVWGAFFARKFAAPMFVTALAALFLTGSRTAWVTAALVVAIFALTVVGRRVRTGVSPWARGLLVVLALAGTWQAVDMFEAGRRVEMTTAILRSDEGLEADRNFAVRVVATRQALEGWSEAPLLGQGPVKEDARERHDSIDNQFASWLVRQGLLGTVALGIFYLLLFQALIWPAFRRNRAGVAALSIATFLPLLAGTFFDNNRMWVVWLAIVFGVHAVTREETALEKSRVELLRGPEVYPGDQGS